MLMTGDVHKSTFLHWVTSGDKCHVGRSEQLSGNFEQLLSAFLAHEPERELFDSRSVGPRIVETKTNSDKMLNQAFCHRWGLRFSEGSGKTDLPACRVRTALRIHCFRQLSRSSVARCYQRRGIRFCVNYQWRGIRS